MVTRREMFMDMLALILAGPAGASVLQGRPPLEGYEVGPAIRVARPDLWPDPLFCLLTPLGQPLDTYVWIEENQNEAR